MMCAFTFSQYHHHLVVVSVIHNRLWWYFPPMPIYMSWSLKGARLIYTVVLSGVVPGKGRVAHRSLFISNFSCRAIVRWRVKPPSYNGVRLHKNLFGIGNTIYDCATQRLRLKCITGNTTCNIPKSPKTVTDQHYVTAVTGPTET